MRSSTQLTREQRYQISALLKTGHNHTLIAGLLQVHRSTVGLDIDRNRGGVAIDLGKQIRRPATGARHPGRSSA